MDYRRCSRWTNWALLGSIVGLLAAVYFWPQTSSFNPFGGHFSLTAAGECQMLALVGIVAAWAMLGPGPWWIRLAAPLACGPWLLRWNERFQNWGLGDSFVVSLVLGVALAAAALCAAGFRIQRAAPSAIAAGALRFSLFSLLATMTAIAVVLGLLEALRPALELSGSDEVGSPFELSPVAAGFQTRQIVMGVAVALAGIGGIWVMLRPGSVVPRTMAACVIAIALSAYLMHLGENKEALVSDTLEVVGALLAVTALTATSALPLRLWDYRLQGGIGLDWLGAPGWTATARCMPIIVVTLLIGVTVFAGLETAATPLRLAERWRASADEGSISLWFQTGSGQYVHPQTAVTGNEFNPIAPPDNVDPFAVPE